MPVEMEPLARRLRLAGASGRWTGHAGEHTVVGIVTGMGPKLATAGVTRLLEEVDVGRVLVVGITGAVDDATPIGTVIVPEAVIDGATGAEYRPAMLEGHPGSGILWTSDRVITEMELISELHSRGVVSLDMETAAVAAVCEQRAVPWAVLRVVSDHATDGSVDDYVFYLSKPDGTPDDEAIERFFAEHPERVEPLTRLAADVATATEAAAEAAAALCVAHSRAGRRPPGR
jgi:adenosylhomocysteine nucleosidase